jgi:hypothetical protein
MVPKDIEERDNYLAKIKSREVMMEIDEKYRIFLKYDDGTPIAEVKMPALPKALYFVFLNHPEGFPLKHLIDYREELLLWYRKLSNRKNVEKYIDKLVDSTDNSANEKISRIREAFEKIKENIEMKSYIPMGAKGECFYVSVDKKRIIWKLK